MIRFIILINSHNIHTLTISLFYFFIFLQCPHLYICIVCMYIWLNCIYLYLNVYCQCLMLTVCTKGLRVTQFQFSVCMCCTCGRIDNKADLTWLDNAWKQSHSHALWYSQCFTNWTGTACLTGIWPTQSVKLDVTIICISDIRWLPSLSGNRNALLCKRKYKKGKQKQRHWDKAANQSAGFVTRIQEVEDAPIARPDYSLCQRKLFMINHL